jgi:hypothetical protein
VCTDLDGNRVCADTANDSEHCGGCWQACSGECRDSVCCAGSCGTRCIPGQYRLSGDGEAGRTQGADLEDLDGLAGEEAVFTFSSLKEPGAINVYWGNAIGLADHLELAASQVGPGLAFGDLDGDGRKDIVVAIASRGSAVRDQLQVFCGTEGPGFEPCLLFDQPGTPTLLALLDVDGDRDLDLAVQLVDDACIALRLGDGAGGLGPATCVTPLGAPTEAEAARWTLRRLPGLDGAPDQLVELQDPGLPTAALVAHRFEDGALVSDERLPTPGAQPLDGFDLWDADGDGELEVVGFVRQGDRSWSVVADAGGSAPCELGDGLNVQDWGEDLRAVGDFDADARMDVVGAAGWFGVLHHSPGP